MAIDEKILEIKLSLEQFKALNELAKHLNTSASKLVKQQITLLLVKEGFLEESYLSDKTTSLSFEPLVLAETKHKYVAGPPKIQTPTPIEEDPLMDIIALGASGLGDLAIKHDYYLSENRTK